MGSSNHLKRLAMPRSWPLPRKTSIWVTRASAGAHARVVHAGQSCYQRCSRLCKVR